VGRSSELPGTRHRGLRDRPAPDKAREDRPLRVVHAFPKIDNGPSNAICRKLGFTLVEEIDFPARHGGLVRCNEWRFDL
jgi:RimJ/RimL family protein N-acetyltransferase